MPKSLVQKTCSKVPIAVLQCTSVLLFAPLGTTLTVFARASVDFVVCFGCGGFSFFFSFFFVFLISGRRKPHQAPHQLAKRPITHVFVLVNFLELQTSRKRVIPPRAGTKPRRGVFSKSLLRNRQGTSIPIPRKMATRLPPQLAQVVDWDKAVQVFTELIAPTINLTPTANMPST